MTDIAMVRMLEERDAENKRLRAKAAAIADILELRWQDVERLEAEIEHREEALQQIEQWSRAYPLEIFPEPDLEKARALLEAGGMTLDAISAYAMRHVVEGVGEIARRALEPRTMTEAESECWASAQRWHERALKAEVEIERLMAAIWRIDGINDNPAHYNPEINAVCDSILRRDQPGVAGESEPEGEREHRNLKADR